MPTLPPEPPGRSPDEVDLLIEADAAQDLDFLSSPLDHTPSGKRPCYLLTGATGFLGGYLLRDLLNKFPDSEVKCLVRAKDETSARLRLEQNIARLGLKLSPKQWSQVGVVPAELGAPQFGLSEMDYARLAAQTQVVVHCAARMNFYENYLQLRPINVEGALNILRFAVTARYKPVHYMSTTGVFDSDACRGKIVTEHDNPAHCRGSVIGYTETKWVAEQLFLRARAQGVPVTIYRAPFIMGDTRTGMVTRENLIVSVILGSIQGGTWPDGSAIVEMIPVDSLSRAMVHFIASPASTNQTYHLSSRKSISWQEGGLAVQAAGYPVEMIPSYDEWKRRLTRFGREKGNALRLLLPLFVRVPRRHATPAPEVFFRPPQPVLKCDETNRLLAAVDLVPPAITYELMATYLRFFIDQGWLALPPARKARSTPNREASRATHA